MTRLPAAPLLQRDKLTVLIVWAALSAATVLAWLLAPGESPSATNLDKELVVAVVALGLIKCRLIIRYFMEVRHAPRGLQIATDGWLAVVWLALLGIYLT
ncbi:cytochrome C oxidase subunit IV family protein [Actinocorallia aurantiaca]|uniref:Cytochrome C oxidase subunit IV family protein n=1 Tax=Actinocorallia aurantiaca TaxID=46204 RepID=A0ABN3UT87_9ACTN